MIWICRRLSLLVLALALGTFLVFQTVLAEEKGAQKTEQKGSHRLEEVTVTDKKVGEPVASPYAVPESSKLATEVITAEEIEALHPETIWDVLEQMPGMEVTFQGRMKLNLLSMRGNGNYGIILDGVYINSADRILATLPTDTIESITVVRDATALSLGPLTNFGSSSGSSNQGFIVIKTKRASQKVEGGAIVSYGSFHTEKEHLYQGAKIGKFDYRVAGTHTSTQGKTNWYNASRNTSVLLRGGYTSPVFFGDLFYYSSRGMRQFQRAENLVPKTAKKKVGKKTITYLDWSTVGELSNQKWEIDPMISDMIAVNLNKPWSDTQTTTFSYAYNSLLVSSTQDSFVGGKPSVRDQNSRGQSASLRHVINSHNNVLRLGGQYFQYVSPDGFPPYWDMRSDEDMYSLFVQDEYCMLGDKLTIDGGIRMDKKHFNNDPESGYAINEWAKETFTYALGTSYKLHRMVTLTGRYAYSENSMSPYQLSADGSKLPPERRSRYEAGILANLHPSFNPSLTLYYYDTKNQKVSSTGVDPTTGAVVSSYIDPVTGEEVSFVDSDDVRTKGLEVGVSGSILKAFTYHLLYSHVTTDNTETNNRTPHHLASGRFSYRYKNADLNLSFRYVSPYSKTEYYELGDYTRVDANIRYNFKVFDRDTRITLYGRNLGDKHYTTTYNTGAFYDPGLQYGVELAYKFW